MRKQPLHPRTAVINIKQKNQAKLARQHVLKWLATKFPEAFDNQLQIRPLKIGIMNDILLHAADAEEQGISKSKLREAVVIFTRRIDYLICLKAQEMRIDLQGNLVDAVTLEDAERATLKIKKRIEKSTKNTKKLVAAKATPSPAPVANPGYIKQNYQPSPMHPPLRAHTGGVAQPLSQHTITIKHKNTRQYDPSVVARLKEKLGLSRSKEDETMA